MREIILDTETTGLSPADHRIVEIGCLELINHMPTGATYHQYINPQQDMPDEAFAIHGLSQEFLSKHPIFAEIADAFFEFIGDSPLVIHNASFDMGFINTELRRLNRFEISMDRAVDTMQLARRKFPGARASLDALCQRFHIDASHRKHHGALKDSQLLAEVYLELIGGRQPGFNLAPETEKTTTKTKPAANLKLRAQNSHAATAEEIAAHTAFLKKLEDPLWMMD